MHTVCHTDAIDSPRTCRPRSERILGRGHARPARVLEDARRLEHGILEDADEAVGEVLGDARGDVLDHLVVLGLAAQHVGQLDARCTTR